jgi:hypothetical protein
VLAHSTHGIMMLNNPILPKLYTPYLIAISIYIYYTSVGCSHLIIEECVSSSKKASKGTTGQPTILISRLVYYIYKTLL